MTECPIVETSLGKVKGVDVGKVEGGKNVFLYTSLPFAKPPIGDLRFERPVRYSTCRIISIKVSGLLSDLALK